MGFFSSELHFHHRPLESLQHFIVTFFYNSDILNTTISYLNIKDAILLLQCLFICVCVRVHFHYFVN